MTGGPNDELSMGTEIVPAEQADITSLLLGGSATLMSGSAYVHPGIVPRADAVLFEKSAKEGDRYFVSRPPYEDIIPAEAELLEDRPYLKLGLRPERGGVIRMSRDSDNAKRPPLFATSEDETARQMNLMKSLENHRGDLVETHELEEGVLVVTNRFGGIDVDPNNLQYTGQSLVLRAVLARELGAEDIGNLIEMGLIDDRLARLIGSDIAELFQNMRKNLDVLGQLPPEALRAAGPPILEHLVAQSTEFIADNRFGIYALALAIRNLSDVQKADGVVLGYQPPDFSKDYTFDALRAGKSGYRGIKIK